MSTSPCGPRTTSGRSSRISRRSWTASNGWCRSTTRICDGRPEIAGKRATWEAEITEQHPDERVAWKATGGKGHAGVVTFHRLSDERSRVTVQLDWQPEGVTENLGAALGFDDRQVRKDLARFKELIESQGVASGAWRGDVEPSSQS